MYGTNVLNVNFGECDVILPPPMPPLEYNGICCQDHYIPFVNNICLIVKDFVAYSLTEKKTAIPLKCYFASCSIFPTKYIYREYWCGQVICYLQWFVNHDLYPIKRHEMLKCYVLEGESMSNYHKNFLVL